MENRRSLSSKRLAKAEAEFPDFSSPNRRRLRKRRDRRNRLVGERTDRVKPQIDIRFGESKTHYVPNDFLICEYDVRGILRDNPVEAIETSVVWRTEGKGETDIGVHLFERRQKPSLQTSSLETLQRISTVLPASPLSYQGKIVKIIWCLRVRLFLNDGTQVTQDQLFQLGSTVPYHELPVTSVDDDGAFQGTAEEKVQGAATEDPGSGR